MIWPRSSREPRKRQPPSSCTFSRPDLLWTLSSLCALHGRPFSAELLAREFPGEAPTESTLIDAAQQLGLGLRAQRLRSPYPLPLLVMLLPAAGGSARPALVTAAAGERFVVFEPGVAAPGECSAEALAARLHGPAWTVHSLAEAPGDLDARQVAGQGARFGFGWFVREALRHRRVWRDVLLASLALQVVSLTTPLFTQAIVDKVVVHRSESTLIAIGVAMALMLVFSAVLGWSRQYLLAHTGNRIDAALGTAVWAHLLKLPPAWFQHRPTGVVAARLQAVETIREFVSGAALGLLLDLPFLVVCLGVMLWYSALLTSVCMAVLALVALAGAVTAPVFQRQLAEQFLLGARNQAFVTEHIAGFDTVKALQMEPRLRQRYAEYLSAFLASGFRTRLTANTYQTLAGALEQAMTLLVLVLGAWTVVMRPDFSIGMLVAFQMFAGRLSQPLMRLVGLWTQFQQASQSVQRLGDLMNAPVEPYSALPHRPGQGPGLLEVVDLRFRHGDDRPLLFEGLGFTLAPGQSVALMGPSGSGKSTLARLLLGFHAPTGGSIRLDGVDTRHLSANALRACFGVVPQETVLFSGTILANLQAAAPEATLEAAAQACRMAGVHEVIQALPQGYQTEIGERGVGLSGGQRQRLAIARALLKRPRILIFDEATSALDAECAEAFARTVNRLKGRVTMLFIAHALPRNLQLDAVLRIGRGAVHREVPRAPARPGTTFAN